MAGLNNLFLLREGVHSNRNNYYDDCFCSDCRNLRVVNFTAMSTHDLLKLFSITLPDEQETHLRRYHQAVLEQIAAGKTFKNVALANSGYVYVKSWAKHHEPWSRWADKDRDKFAANINLAVLVFDKWDTIVRNLTDPRMTEINARAFSMGLFYEARKLSWCLTYNETIRRKKSDEKPDLYPEDLYLAIRDNIRTSGVLNGMAKPNDPHIAAMMMKRLSSDVVEMCRRLPHPPSP